MPHFLVEYRELGRAGLREERRGAHIAYRKGLGGGMPLAGPLLDEAGEVTGSVTIVEAADLAAAQALAAADPYVQAEVFELVAVRRYRIAAMKPPG